MFSLSRTLEILLFAFCNFAPYVALSYFIFKKHFRYSKSITIISCIAMVLIQFATRYWSALHGINTSALMSLVRLFVFILGYAILFDQRFGKVLFIELIFANMGNFILIAAVCLERNLFPKISHSLYCWHASVVMILLHVIITLPWTFQLKKLLIPMLQNRRVNRGWNYYWLVPLVFYIIWQYQVNGGTRTGLENIQDPYNVIFLFVINIGALLIYYLMIMLDGQLLRNIELEEQQHYHELERVEYQVLHNHMEETKRMRHDLRHHIHNVKYYLEHKEYDNLQKYVDSYQDSIPDASAIHFCNHPIINNIIFHFACKAKSREIDFVAQLSISEDVPIDDYSVSVLLGNLLENAIDACSEQTGSKRQIVMKGKGDATSLIFTIDNTFQNKIKKDKDGNLLTTKKTGSGIGLTSAKKIVERYNGFFSARQEDGMFCVSFMLNF